MGAWGIKAHECDSCLDMLTVVKRNILTPIDFMHFDVAVILDYLKDHIIEQIKKTSKGCSKEMMEFYIEVIFPQEYNDAVFLVAECLTDYIQNGEYLIYDYDVNIERKITKFNFTDGVLEELLEELKKMLDPEHDMYISWVKEEVRQTWIAHMEMMCNSIASLKGGISNG